jgi:hypothetical protein
MSIVSSLVIAISLMASPSAQSGSSIEATASSSMAACHWVDTSVFVSVPGTVSILPSGTMGIYTASILTTNRGVSASATSTATTRHSRVEGSALVQIKNTGTESLTKIIKGTGGVLGSATATNSTCFSIIHAENPTLSWYGAASNPGNEIEYDVPTIIGSPVEPIYQVKIEPGEIYEWKTNFKCAADYNPVSE